MTEDKKDRPGISITVRGLDQATYEALKQAARAQNISISQYIRDAIQERLELRKSNKLPHCLDKYFGKWDQDEFDRVMKSVQEQRRIDEELWR